VTAASVSIAAIYYAFTLRINMRTQELALKAQQQTLETRQAQMFMSIYNQLTSKEFVEAWKILSDQKWKNWGEFQKLMEDPNFQNAQNMIGTYFEGLGVLVREGHLNIRLIALMMCGTTIFYYKKIEPILVDARKAMGYSRFMSETVYLYKELEAYLVEHPELSTEFKEPDAWYRPIKT